MRIKYIKAADTHALRHRVLRPHQPIEEVDFPNDRNPEAFHLGAYLGEHLVGVASFYPEKHEALKGWKQFRLRGMAAHPDFQGQGVGQLLLGFGIQHVRAQKGDLLWCNAREKARGFYEKQGFAAQGDAFPMGDIGLHYTMYKRL